MMYSEKAEDMEEDSPLMSELDEAARERAFERFRFLRPFLEENIPLARLAKEENIPLRTARYWVKQYRNYGLLGLARKPRDDQGKHRGIASELESLVEGLALEKPKLSMTTIHRKAEIVARAHGWDPPKYWTVRRIIEAMDPAMLLLAHEGSAVYQQTYDLLYQRDSIRPNEIWQADHSVLNLWLRDENDQPAKPLLTVIEDDYSRAIAGYFLAFNSPSAIHTALAFRQAIWRKEDARWRVCGIPDVFYTDHGSDFTSKHIEQVAAQLNVRLVFSIVGQPRGRGRIERFFQTIHQLFICELPGYAPEGPPPKGPLLTLPEFDMKFREFLLEVYHHRNHGTTNMPPLDRWEADGFLPRLPESLEELDLLLLTVQKTRRVRRDGIYFQWFCYIDLTLAAYVGEDITIRYDPRDMATIRVYYRERFLCRAVCQELAGQTISLKEVIKARRHHRKEIRKGIEERLKVVDTLLETRRQQPQEIELPCAEVEPQPSANTLKRYRNE
jgi:putative transposase